MPLTETLTWYELMTDYIGWVRGRDGRVQLAAADGGRGDGNG